MAEHTDKEEAQKLKETVSQIEALIDEKGFPNSLMFIIGNPQGPNNSHTIGSSFLKGDTKLILQNVTAIMSVEDRVFNFFSDAVENARKNRNSKNPNVN